MSAFQIGIMGSLKNAFEFGSLFLCEDGSVSSTMCKRFASFFIGARAWCRKVRTVG